MLGLIWWVIVGLIAGWITGKIMKGSGYGAWMDIILGIVGAIIGGFLMRLVGFTGSGGMIYTIIIAVIGAVILTWVVRNVMGNKSAL
jgi:uncharacterized membrane protein YeaQ/YmgE (transglycosylase-associated protein family)